MHVHIEVAWSASGVDRPWESVRVLSVRLATFLASAGHSITIRGGAQVGEHGGIRYLVATDPLAVADVLVCVNTLAPPDLVAGRKLYWSHAAASPCEGDWDAIVTNSEYHRALLRERLPSTEIVAIPPGCEPVPTGVPRDRFLYASAPDRGLHRLLAMWPALWARFGVPLAITGDIRALFTPGLGQPTAAGQRLRDVAAMLDQPGVIVHGPLSAEQMGSLRSRSIALLYPLDPVIPHAELYSLAVLDGCAAGVPPVLSDGNCLATEYAGAATFVPGFASTEWIRAIEDVVHDRPGAERRARAHASARTWEAFEEAWNALLARPARPRMAAPSGGAWLVVAELSAGLNCAMADALVAAALEAGHHVHRVEPDASESSLAAGFDQIVLVGARACSAAFAHYWGSPTILIDAGPPELLAHIPGLARLAAVLLPWPPQVLTAALPRNRRLVPTELPVPVTAVGAFVLPEQPGPQGDIREPGFMAAVAQGRPACIRVHPRMADDPWRRLAVALFATGAAEMIADPAPEWLHLPALPSRPAPEDGAPRAVALIEGLGSARRTPAHWAPELRP